MKDNASPTYWILEGENEAPGDTEWRDRLEISDEPEESESDETLVLSRNLSEQQQKIGPSEPASDIGYVLSVAGRFPLLSAGREKELATNLWRSRKRLYRAIEAARKSPGSKLLAISVEKKYSKHLISTAARRRLIAVEDYAERLVRLINGASSVGPEFDRSLSALAAATPRRRGRRHDHAWSPPMLSKKQVRSILPILQEELEAIHGIREEFVHHNLRLVVWVAKSYRGRGFDMVDVIQEGSMGLLRAIDRFDPAHGTRFSTFATHWVRQGIGRALAEKARMIRIPLNRLAEVREVMTTQSRLAERHDRRPTLHEIATEMDVGIEKVKELLLALGSVDSLDAPLPSGDLNQADILADEMHRSPLEYAEAEEMTSSVKRLLEHMPPQHGLILAMRYGIGYPRECTLEEIGRALGLSRERIRQIEKVAREQFRDVWGTASDPTNPIT